MRIFAFMLLQRVVAALSSVGPTKILVSGASGKTGRLVFEGLQTNPKFEPKALVRSEKSGNALRKAVPDTGLDQIVVCDVTELNEIGLPPDLDDCDALVICTSAMPTISKVSLAKALLKAPFNMMRGRKAIDFRSLRFVWKNRLYPEKVDYEGQVAQIEMAKKIGIKHVVVVGSMGGTDPDNFLNSVGKNADGSGNGDILLWKRKAEKHLVDSGLDFTIIHPGGLTDTPAGEEEFVLDVDDKLLSNKKRSVSRADVANLCLAALMIGKGKKIALDCITQPRDDDGPVKTAEEALEMFLQDRKVYDYAL